MRQCGDCQLCCKLLPVDHFKDAGERCKYQRAGKGCTVYNQLQMPTACALWNCRWLVEDGTAELARPDRAHYVIDVVPDFVTVTVDETGARAEHECIQVWCDPDYPDAHRDRALRRYIDGQGKIALVRYDNAKAIALFPPSISVDREWHEITSGMVETEHTVADKMRVLGTIPWSEGQERAAQKRLAKMSSARYRRRMG